MHAFRASARLGGGLKISVLVPTLSRGGMTRAYWLALLIKKLGHEVEIVGPLAATEEIYPVPPENLPVTAVAECGYPQLVGALLKRLDGDLIYAVKPKPTSFGVALVDQLINRRPVILDIDDWELNFCTGGKHQSVPAAKRSFNSFRATVNGKRRIRRVLQRNHPLYTRWLDRCTNRADAVTVNNRFLQKRYGGTYLPSGKDTDLFDPARFDPELSRRRYDLTQYRVLMFPGTPAVHKGLEDVLTALETLQWPDLRLVLVGGRKEADAYARKLLERWGRWIIRLPEFPLAAIPDLVAAAHVVVIPQRDVPIARAQCPMKLTDAMAMAKPILCTAVGEIAAVVGDTAYLVAPSSPDQIAQRLVSIFQDPAQARLQGIRARERCVARYSLHAVAPVLAGVIARSKAGEMPETGRLASLQRSPP